MAFRTNCGYHSETLENRDKLGTHLFHHHPRSEQSTTDLLSRDLISPESVRTGECAEAERHPESSRLHYCPGDPRQTQSGNSYGLLVTITDQPLCLLRARATIILRGQSLLDVGSIIIGRGDAKKEAGQTQRRLRADVKPPASNSPHHVGTRGAGI